MGEDIKAVLRIVVDVISVSDLDRDVNPVSISGVPPGRGDWLWVMDTDGFWAQEIVPV